MSGNLRPFAILAVLSLPMAATPRCEDGRIEDAARRSYTFKVHLKDDAIQVASRDGIVTLTGTVANTYHRFLAEETIAGLPGVRGVDNRLKVEEAAPAETSDAWLATKVRTALLYQRNVESSRIHVDVRNRVVILTGQVSRVARKALAADVAQNVDGVDRVENRIRVGGAPPRKFAERMDDASVTAQVKAALLVHKGTHLLTTHVRTERGVVSVEGTVRDSAERDLVTRVVVGIQGVRRVENHMRVQGHPP